MALQKPGSRREGRRLDTVLGTGRRYRGVQDVCKGWEVVVSGSGAHLGLERPLQGAKGDSWRETGREPGHSGREGHVRLWREGH